MAESTTFFVRPECISGERTCWLRPESFFAVLPRAAGKRRRESIDNREWELSQGLTRAETNGRESGGRVTAAPDDELRIGDLDADPPASLMPLVSDAWSKHFTWDAVDPIPADERARLTALAARAHEQGRWIRFWAAPDRPLASWFLASRPSNPIARKWKDATDEFWSRAAAKGGATNVADDPGSLDYFWFHGLFQNLLDTDTEVEALWRKTPQVSADGPHYLQQRGLVSAADDAVRLHVYNKSTNVYKLSRRIDLPDRLEGSVLSALFDTLS